MTEINIGGRLVGDAHPPLVVAEIGINHEGSIDLAIALADVAINAGAEVIKHQTHVIDDEMSSEAKAIIPGNAEISIFEIMQACALNEADERKLMNHIVSRKGIFISTPFSRQAAERLQRFDVPAFKIGSGECNNYPLIKHVAKFGKPMIISTGMNSIASVRPTVDILRAHKVPFALLHCTNVYPTPPELVRLGGMSELKEAFPDAVIGLSDHTTSNHACFGAAALGASMLERHFTDTMSRQGPDIVCSMDPSALMDLIEGSKNIFLARGGVKGPIDEEKPTIAFAFASVVAMRKIGAGEELSEDNIWLRRPGDGDYSASDYQSLLGRKVQTEIAEGVQVKRSDLVSPDTPKED